MGFDRFMKKNEDTQKLFEKGYADAYIDFLKKKGIKHSANLDENGHCLIRLQYSLKNDLGAIFSIIFNREESLIRILLYGFLRDVPLASEPAVLEKLNEVNRNKTFYKFYLDTDREIVLSWYFPHFSMDMPFCPDNLFRYTNRMLECLEELYPDLYETVHQKRPEGWDEVPEGEQKEAKEESET